MGSDGDESGIEFVVVHETGGGVDEKKERQCHAMVDARRVRGMMSGEVARA